MSTKEDYTPEEWQLLLDVPPAVGTAVMYAGRSGVGSVKEAMAMASGILGSSKRIRRNELISSLVDARIKNGEKSSIETLSSPYRGLSPEDVLDDAVEKCRAVVELLENKATPSEIDGYRDWAMSLAEKVANAAKEGGFLGIGGERVSEDERAALKAVRAALALKRGR